jgi:tRNA(Ile2) C34 agmatinyltransferase TiaS
MAVAMRAMTAPPMLVCPQCGRRFAESTASGFRCNECAERDERKKMHVIERKLRRDHAGLRQMPINAKGGS